MACTVINRCLPLTAECDAQLRAVRDALTQRTGRATYVSALLYGLQLAAAHLGIDAPDPLPLPPRADTDGLPAVPQKRKRS